MITDSLLKSLAIASLLEAGTLTVGACLYWGAFKKMKKSPIIGWVAGVLTAGALVGLTAAIALLFPSPTHFRTLIGTRIILSLTVVMFIKESLTPPKSRKNPIIKLEKDVKKHAENHKKSRKIGKN